MANPVCYDDVIYLDFDDSILFANGFFDSNLYFVSKPNAAVKSFKNGLFKLYPNFSYKDISQVDQLKDQLDLLKSLNPQDELAFEELNKDLQDEQKALEERDTKLELLNDKIFAELRGKPIRYGQKIQLFHMESQTFVRPAKSFNEDDKTLVNLELGQQGNKNVYFKFVPMIGFIQEGDVVEYNIPLKVVSIKLDQPIVKGPEVNLSNARTILNEASNTVLNNQDNFPPVQPRRREPLFQQEKVSQCGCKPADIVENTYIRKFINSKDLAELKKKRALVNGDYIRITNDKVYLTVIQGRNEDLLCFQNYGSNSLKSSSLYTLFQIIETQDDPSLLPRGSLMEYQEGKKYVIRHVASGKILGADETGKLKLYERNSIEKGTETISLVLKNKIKDSAKATYIDKNSIMQLNFHSASGKEEGTLSIGGPQKLPTGNLDTNTSWFFGFKLTDDYLNKVLRTERFKPVVKKGNLDDKTSYLKFTKLSFDEITSTFLVESMANQFTAFTDYLDEFIKGKHPSLRGFNRELSKLLSCCQQFEKQMYENSNSIQHKDSQVPSSFIQILVREFRIYDMIFRLFFYMVRDTTLLNKVKEIRDKGGSAAPSLNNLDRQKGKNSFTALEDPQSSQKVSYKDVLELFSICKKIIFISYKKNNINRYYCSQFIRVPINCMLGTDHGLFSLAHFTEKLAMKDIMLEISKKGLWDEDLDALGQLNYYEEELFHMVETQETFHTIYLRLIEHISLSKAPNLINTVRDHFVLKFLQKEGVLEHLFPRITDDQDKIYLEFTRKAHPTNNFKIALDQLDEKALSNKVKKNAVDDRVRQATNYLIASLDLLGAIALIGSPSLNLQVVRYYRYDTLVKTITTLKSSLNHTQIRQNLSEMMNRVHQRFFSLPFTKVPNRLQILNEDTFMNTTMGNIDSFIQNAVNTNLSAVELEFMRNQDAHHLSEQLKNVITSDGDVAEVLNLLRSNPTVTNLEEAQSLLEEVKKIFETTGDISFEFLQVSHNVLLKLINEAEASQDKSLFDFILEALEVFTLVEKNMVSYAAIDIIGTLKNKNLLGIHGRENGQTGHAKSHKRNLSAATDPNSSTIALRSPTKKVTPSGTLHHKELSTKYGLDTTVVSGAISTFSKDWKSGEKLMSAEKFEFNKIISIEDSYKQSGAGVIVQTLLNISLLGQDILLNQVIQQLKRIASFESLLYIELNKLTIIHNAPALKQTSEVINATFRLNEISREITFRDENKLPMDDSSLNQVYDELLDLVWKIFFIIYNPNKHFKYQDLSVDAVDRFKNNFLDCKKEKWAICFQINDKAINRPFQKIFSILNTHKALLQTLEWVANKKKEDNAKSLLVSRLIIVTLMTYLSGNRENQDRCSTSNNFIKIFYSNILIEQSSDVLSLFSEMMRDNKRLLKLPYKYLFDITTTTIIQTLERKIGDNETNNYLATAIMGYDFLFKCEIPQEIYDPLTDLRAKWEAIAAQKFNSLNVFNFKDDLTVLPFCYYSIKETFESTLKIVPDFAAKGQMYELQRFLTFNDWLHLMSNETFLLQFQLRNLFTKSISQFYYENGKKGKFCQNIEEASAILSCLVFDLLNYRNHVSKKEGQDSPKLRELRDIATHLTTNETFEKLKVVQNQNKGLDFSKKKLRIFIEDFTLESLFFEYINEGCLDLLLNLVLSEVDYCTEVKDKKATYRTIMDFVLDVIEEFIEFEGSQERFPYKKVEDFLSRVSTTKGYEVYKTEIITLTNKLYAGKKGKGRHIENMLFALGGNTIEITPLDSYHHHLNELQKQKQKLKEQNIQELANHIAEHDKSDQIIQGIMKYLSKDPSKLQSRDVSFLLKLLRKYIEREHSNNPNDDPIYKWKDVNLGDLKKIEKIQGVYRDLGLTEVLYNFLNPDDRKVYRESLLLSLAYMYGGNRSVQEQYFSNFTDDDENKVLSNIGKDLTHKFNRFREKESERMYHTYKQVQRNLFEHYKGKKTLDNIAPEELTSKAFETGIEQKYKEFADRDLDNQLFMLTLTFLQTICEGQYTDMQIFLREQSFKGRVYPQTFDFIGFLRHSINTYHKVLNKYNLSVGLKLLELINELIQGEVYDNIHSFLNKTFVYDMCRILTDYNTRYHTLPRGFGLDPFDEEFRILKSRVIFVFKIMLENRDEHNLQLLDKHLDKKGLMETFTNLVNYFLKKNNLQNSVTNLDNFILSLSNEDFKYTLGDALNIYIIFRYLWENPTEFNDNMRDLISKMDKKHHDVLGRVIFTICKRLVNSIELVADSKSTSLLRIWFPVLAVCNYLTDDAMKNFVKNVDRSNSQTKISDLMDASGEFIPLMESEYNAKQRILGFNVKNTYSLVRLLTNAIGLAVTILNIASFSINANNEEEQSDECETAQKILNIVQIALSGIMVLLWFLFYSKRHRTLAWDRFVDNNVKNIGFLPPTIMNKLDEGNYDELDENDCEQIMLLKGANSDEFADMREHAPNEFKKISTKFWLYNNMFLFNSPDLLWHIIYVGICIGSLFHPIVAVFQIFDIAIRSDTIKQISASISKNAGQFLWTLFLLAVVNVVYSSVGFFFLNDQFVMDDTPLCTNAFSCFINTLNLGLRSGGGIADAIGTLNYSSTSKNGGQFFARAIFDLSFFIIMIILFLNLIFGMIIDAFGDLRDQKTSNDEDQNNVCFICGIERSEFERHINFEQHILGEHNIWSYIYYLVYLLDRAETAKVEMTDIENMVLKKYNQKDFSWVPVGQSLTLEEIYEKEKLNKENELDKVTKKVDTIQKTVSELDARFTTKMEQILSIIKK